MIPNDTRSPAIIREIDENSIFGLAQEKENAIIEAFLPCNGIESFDLIDLLSEIAASLLDFLFS